MNCWKKKKTLEMLNQVPGSVLRTSTFTVGLFVDFFFAFLNGLPSKWWTIKTVEDKISYMLRDRLERTFAHLQTLFRNVNAIMLTFKCVIIKVYYIFIILIDFTKNEEIYTHIPLHLIRHETVPSSTSISQESWGKNTKSIIYLLDFLWFPHPLG